MPENVVGQWEQLVVPETSVRDGGSWAGCLDDTELSDSRSDGVWEGRESLLLDDPKGCPKLPQPSDAWRVSKEVGVVVGRVSDDLGTLDKVALENRCWKLVEGP